MRITHVWFTPLGPLVESTNAIGTWWWPDYEPGIGFVLDTMSEKELAAATIRVTDRLLLATTGCPLDEVITASSGCEVPW